MPKGKHNNHLSGKEHPNYKHGLTGSRTYQAHNNMMRRCYTLTNNRYQYYGGRGIEVVTRWWDFTCFLEDMGICPPDYQLDRRDHNGNYSPDNCRWVDYLTQANNKSTTAWVTHEGHRHTLKEWSVFTGIPYKTLFSRYKYMDNPSSAQILQPLLKHDNRRKLTDVS